MSLTYGSVCSGIEAASVAWEPIGMKPLWFSEIEPFPCAVLGTHWPQVDNLGDMTKIAAAVRAGDVPAPDLLVGGTPCQAFSVSGMRGGMSDERGKLTLSYVELADAIDDKREENNARPAIIVWENVKGVLSSEDNAFGCFIAGLAGEDEPLEPGARPEHGKSNQFWTWNKKTSQHVASWPVAGCVIGPKRTVAWRVLNAKYLGVAQGRPRVFVIASAGEEFSPTEVLLEYQSMQGNCSQSCETGESYTDKIGICPEKTSVTIYRIRSFGEYVESDHASTLKARDHKDSTDLIVTEDGVRRLTPIECERLQGFPDNHTQISWRGKDAADCPDGPRYRAIGNSMAVPVMRWIGERILAALPVQQMANQPEVTKTNDKPESTGIPMSYQLIGGRCEHALKNLPDNSVDSIVTDPPYGIGFMSNKWDYSVPTVEQWAECLRVLKPGGHLLAFGGSRTYHRLVVNIEDAGFEIRDQIMWIYGSGFPKSKNLDGEHKGKGTALKPAHEPIVMARKPFNSTILDNVTEYGTGALNIDLCRVPTEEMLAGGSGGLLSDVRDGKTPAGGEWTQNNEGRWPANIIHDGSDEVITAFPDAKGQQGKLRNDGSDNGNRVYGALKNVVSNPEPRTESASSAARFFYCAKVSKSDRDAGMERFIAASASEMTGGRAEGSAGINNPRAGAGRTGGAKNTHPTVKPVDLMRYLCRLVTPAGGTVLDPFMGSGSTGKAAIAEGFRFIGIEMDPDHLVTAAARIGHAVKEMEKTGEAA